MRTGSGTRFSISFLYGSCRSFLQISRLSSRSHGRSFISMEDLQGSSLGLVFVAARTWQDWKKDRIEKEGLAALFIGAVSVQAVFQIMMVVLNEGSMFASIGTSVLFLGLLLFIWKDVQVSGSHLLQLSMLFMAVHLFVASIQPKGLMNPPLFVTLLLGLFFTGLVMKKPLFEQNNGGNPIE